MPKRKDTEINLEQKYKALLELDKGKSNKDVPLSFGIPPNTLSNWKKSKERIFEAYRNGKAKTKRVKCCSNSIYSNVSLFAFDFQSV